MPSPSENRAIDIVLAAFPGSEVISPDRTKPIVKGDGKGIVDDGWGDKPRVKKPKPPARKRGSRKVRGMDSMFDA